MNDAKHTKLTFAAINPIIETNIVAPTETELRHQNFVEFGTRNEYPNYIYSLFTNCATLHSIIEGTTDFVCGEAITSAIPSMTDNEMEEFVRDLSLDLLIYGGAYIEVLRNRFGKVIKVNTLNFRNVRTNADNTKFYYSKGFSELKSYGRCKCQVYDKFDLENESQAVGIYYIKNIKHQVYPSPIWSSSVIAAEIEKNINQYHLNNLSNGFTATHVVNFNNGVPSDDIKEEIERAFNEKFSGSENAGRMMLSFNDDKEHAVSIETLQIQDYGEQYKTLADRSRNELFVAFKATPNIFGLPTETTGFNTQEYSAAFKLYEKFTVKPIQKRVIQALENIFMIDNPVTIEPFKIDFDEQ